MSDFSYLEALDVTTDKTIEYPLHQITVNEKTPVLLVAPATEANKPYFNALLKRAGKMARAMRTGNMTAAMLEDKRDEDKELYPKYVIKGWSDVSDATGKEVKFSKAECKSFIDQLPNWLFDDLCRFCENPGSFVEVMDVELEAKN